MTGDSRRGRRDNGLDAAAFVPLLDVDPRVGEHLLDVLASAGVVVACPGRGSCTPRSVRTSLVACRTSNTLPMPT